MSGEITLTSPSLSVDTFQGKAVANITDPQWGGADSNGDWTTAWNNAANYLETLYQAGDIYRLGISFNGSVIFVPPGNYLIGKTNPAVSLMWPDQCKIQGGGKDSTFIVADKNMTANRVQTYGYGNPTYGGQGQQIDDITITQNSDNPSPIVFQTWNVASGITAGVLTLQTAPSGDLLVDPIMGLPVSASNPGFCLVSDSCIQYTGISGNTLTGVLTPSGGATSRTMTVNAEVRAYKSNGHGLAIQTNTVYIGRNVHILKSVGSNIYLQNAPISGGNPLHTSSNTYGHDIEPSRLENPGRFQVEGNLCTDVRCGGFSGLGNQDGFGGIIAGGDWLINPFHHVGPPTADCPAVIVVAGATVIEAVVMDTLQCAVVRLDNSGRWAQPGPINDPIIKSVSWVNSGEQMPQSPVLGPIMEYVDSGSQHLNRAKVKGISIPNSRDFIFKCGPSTIIGGAQTLSTPGPFTLITRTTYGFNILGGATYPLQVGTGSCTYTGKQMIQGVTGSASGTLTNGSAGILTVTATGYATSGVIWVDAVSGTVEQAYQSITTTSTTTTFNFNSWSGSTGVIAKNTYIHQGQFTGCVGDGSAQSDQATVTQNSMDTGTVSQIDVSDIPLVSGGLNQYVRKGANNTAANYYYPPQPSSFFNPSNPSSTTSTTGVFMGLGSATNQTIPVQYTPLSTGKINVRISGTVQTAVAAVAATLRGYYGNGTAPTNGTAIGSIGTPFPTPAISARCSAAAAALPFYIETTIQVTIGSTFWFDVDLSTSSAADAASISSLNINIQEGP